MKKRNNSNTLNLPKSSVFNNVDEYTDFAQKYHVYGADAIKLKKAMDKELIPVLRVKKEKHE